MASMALKKPRLLMTVTTTSPERTPRSLLSRARMAMILSPSTTFPRSSTASTLSASPSKAKATSCPEASRSSTCVEPPLAYIFAREIGSGQGEIHPDFPEHQGRYLVGRPVGAVEEHLHTLSRRTQLLEHPLRVYTCGVAWHLHTSDIAPGRARKVAAQQGLDLTLFLRGELAAIS